MEARKDEKQSKFRIEKLEERIAPSNANSGPPGEPFPKPFQ
jgi:hypothetical protein